ncbi:Alpha/Beta hydrolase protein [Xylaria nigripes]|nr:Alpha/Beta hydrolase protein [Xylaria nigripes]
MGFFRRKKQVRSPRPSESLDTSMQQDPTEDLLPASPFHPTMARSIPPSPPIGSPASGSRHNQSQNYYAPIIVNHHYYINPPQPHPYPHPYNAHLTSHRDDAMGMLELDSHSEFVHHPVNVVSHLVDDDLPRWRAYGTELLDHGASLYHHISWKFDDVLTMIDCDKFTWLENYSHIYHQKHPRTSSPHVNAARRSGSRVNQGEKSRKDSPHGQAEDAPVSFISSSYFSKAYLYANSRLPLDLPLFRVTTPTYNLIHLAAQYSEKVYDKARGAERQALVDADFRNGTKAMYIKSVPMDDMSTIVFAIRGTATFMDWAVNLNTAPTAPTGFLDDSKNLCHAGFLSVARKMVAPVASRLRQLLEEDPGRCAYSLVITGHSAGGAVASLLYMHMLATSKATSSELNMLTVCFKRIHCITFGSPPVSLFPLQTPRRHDLKKSLFFAFVNEGDPVTRADKAYVKSLLELFAATSPAAVEDANATKPGAPSRKRSKSALSFKNFMRPDQSRSAKRKRPTAAGPVWRVPPSSLSNAGLIVVLRSSNPLADVKHAGTLEERLREEIVAEVASDEELRGLVWGDPVCHVMKLYAARIEALAPGAATAGRWTRDD